ncbi:unnamed protein product [Cuscuta campestris]|uniref:Uncharacterized protein n=1 Tax=Cuscuta campestris TaxID=132261 RepID=A0A484LBK4_9ASTE|nr:unnamed protein product [Cuscuta campestris]
MAAVQRATTALDSGEGEAAAGSSATAAGGSATLSGGYWRRKQRRRCNSALAVEATDFRRRMGSDWLPARLWLARRRRGRTVEDDRRWLLQLDSDDWQLAHGGAAPVGDDGGEAGEGDGGSNWTANDRLGNFRRRSIGEEEMEEEERRRKKKEEEEKRRRRTKKDGRTNERR